MTKQELITAVAERTKQSEYVAREMIEATVGVITQAMQSHEDVVIRGFGTFKVTERSARTARNIRTGEPIYIAARDVVTFEPGKDLQKI